MTPDEEKLVRQWEAEFEQLVDDEYGEMMHNVLNTDIIGLLHIIRKQEKELQKGRK